MNQESRVNLPSVLIVDDNVKNLQVLGGYLKMEGLNVEFALDGLSALNWLDRKQFDLILLDVMMPVMDGYDVCSVIKQNPTISGIPIIFITAKTDTESIIKGFEAGAVDYIAKPFIQSELLVRVKTQLSIKRSKEKIALYLHEIETKNREINASIEYARYIQNAVLSTSDKYLKYLPEHYILYLPKDILSGDFYWVCKVGNNLIIAVMDCTGHGVPGALTSILGITLLNEIVLNDNVLQPDKILESLRKKIIQSLGQKGGDGHIRDGIEGLVINFDVETNKLMYSGAFNPLILIHSGEMICIKADNIPIGYLEGERNFSLHERNIEKGDVIYMFSDGIIDQFGGHLNRRFMLRHLKEIFCADSDKRMEKQKDQLNSEIDIWKGEIVQTDDIIVMGIRF